MADVQGVVLEKGVSDWQIFQQNKNGVADISMSGKWGGAPKGTVELRLVREDNAVLVASHLDWQSASTNADGSWSAILKNVPAGGLYRLETHLRTDPKGPAEWQMRGDMRHFLGVGDLWMIAGQSNSAGYGRGPYFDPPELGTHLFNNAMQWALASQPLNESTNTVHPENREGGNSGHGPWMHFARLIRQQVNIPIGLVQVSLGGSPLSSWNPTEKGDHPLYQLMMRAHSAVGGKVRGILWYQGESEAGTLETASSHTKRFINAVKAWRKAMKQPELHVLTVQIGHWMDGGGAAEPDKLWTIVRETQRQIPQRLRNVTVSPTLDLTLTDGIHVGPFSNLLIAQRVAQAALATVYGKPVHYLAPQPKEIRAAADKKVLEIEFENVTGRMDSIEVRAIPFRVEDEQGVATVNKVEYTSSAIIRLHLERSITGKTVVHGGYGSDPQTVPMDMDRMMPMLSFYGFPISYSRGT